MYLVFDCSAVDKPKDWKAPYSDTFNWPRLVHLSWIVLDADLRPLYDYDSIVRPEGYVFDENIQKKCKIDIEDFDQKKSDLEGILKQFSESVNDVQYLIAHNLNFNENVLAAEYIRKGIPIKMFEKERMCLMQEGTYYCKLPSKTGGYKWPSLLELHSVLFNKGYAPASNARADVIAASRCFIKLKKMGALEDYFDV